MILPVGGSGTQRKLKQNLPRLVGTGRLVASGSVQRGAALKDLSICEGIFPLGKGDVVPFFVVPFQLDLFFPKYL